MNVIVGLPCTLGARTLVGHDSIWVIVDILTKSSHFLRVKSSSKVINLARLFVAEIVGFHGVPSSIVSDRNLKFTLRFWRELHKEMGTSLDISSANRSQSDGQTE